MPNSGDYFFISSVLVVVVLVELSAGAGIGAVVVDVVLVELLDSAGAGAGTTTVVEDGEDDGAGTGTGMAVVVVEVLSSFLVQAVIERASSDATSRVFFIIPS